MSGRLDASTPWVRAALPAADRASVEAMVPDGHRLVIGARRPGTWNLVLYRDGAEVGRTVASGEPIPSLVSRFLGRVAA